MTKKRKRQHRLSSHEIYEVKKLLTDGRWTQEDIARKLNTTQPTISAIKHGRIGTHVPWPSVQYDGKFIPTMEIGAPEAERIRAKADLENKPWKALTDEQWESRKKGIARWREEVGLSVLYDNEDEKFWESHLQIWEIAQQSVRAKTDDELVDKLVFEPPTEEDIAQLEKDKEEFSRPRGPATYMKMSIPKIVELGKGKRIVELALSPDSSPALKEALQIVCNFHKDPDCWKDEFFIKQVREMEVRLRQWPEAMERIRKEQYLGSEIMTPPILNEGDPLPPRTQAAIDRELESEFREVDLPPERKPLLQENVKKLVEDEEG